MRLEFIQKSQTAREPSDAFDNFLLFLYGVLLLGHVRKILLQASFLFIFKIIVPCISILIHSSQIFYLKVELP